MAKRFTDSRKWNDPWFRKLPLQYKLFWYYLLDTCDHAGIYKVDIEHANFCIGKEVDLESILHLFNKNKERITVISEEEWFISGFINFQYGELHENSKTHISVIAILKSKGVYKGYTRGMDTTKDKDKVKDKDKDISLYIEILDDLNSLINTSFKHTSKKTQDLIQARISEGYTVEDFKKVHQNKYKEWKNDVKMVTFLRPETLYGNKFESYLQQSGKGGGYAQVG